jgi:hypothetical protein
MQLHLMANDQNCSLISKMIFQYTINNILISNI